MSTVEVEYRDAECPVCGVEALEYFDRYLRTSELVEMCGCGVEPEYERVYCYQAVCDHCGDHVTEYGEYNALTPEWFLWESLPDWQHIGGRDLCSACWWMNDNDEIKEVTT